MLDLLVLLAFAMALVSFFFWLVKFLRRQGKTRDENLCFWLAKEVNGRCVEGSWSGFGELIQGMVDFGIGVTQPKYVVVTRDGGMDVVFFEIDDKPFHISVSSPYTSAWCGCIIRSGNALAPPMLVFRRDVGAAELEGCRETPERWHRRDLEGGPLKGYTVVSPDLEGALDVLGRGLASLLVKAARAVEGRVLPRHLALQVVGDRVALYTHQRGLTEVEHFLALFEGAKGVLTVLAGNRG